MEQDQIVERVGHVQDEVASQPIEPAVSSPLTSQPSNAKTAFWGRFNWPFLGAILGSLVTATALVFVNINVARYQKRLDRMYQILSETGKLADLLEGYTWNVWYARKLNVGTDRHVTDLQQIEAGAKGLKLQLPLVFDDRLAERMEGILKSYWEVTYPITHSDEFPALATTEEMNNKLNPVIASSGELTRTMQEAISNTETASWWDILFGKR